MIKICFVTTISLTLKSFVLRTAEYLHSTGEFEITMICNPDEEFAKSLPPYITYIPVKMKRGVSFDGLKVIKQLKKIFLEKKFDIVQYSTPNASCYASIAAKKAKIPVRLYCQWGIAYVGFSGFKRIIMKAIEKKTCKCSTWIEPDSKSNLEFAHKEKLYPERIGSVVWNGSACGVDLGKFDYSHRETYRKQIRQKYSIPSNSFVFGFVGRITGDKGINELFEAFKMILKNKEAYLMLIGNPEKTSTVNNEYYDWAKTSKNVIFCGYTNEVEKYLSAMDCFVLPSYREGFGLGVVEASAMGLPVIVTNIPGPIDAMIPNQTGLIVETKNVNYLYKAMSIYLDDKKLALQHGLNGIRFAKSSFEQACFMSYLLKDRLKLFNN